mmetsp:Transcript_23479/g.42055  ORF Transcript_23479/g.42055 Transcript_23479/m.42055 type:complete len:88 (+) Transcript_23479:441-704(+)
MGNVSFPSSKEFMTSVRRCSNERIPRVPPKKMHERQAEKHTSPIVDERFGPPEVSGIKPTQTKKKHIVPIPILNPLNGDLSMVDRVS